MSLQDFAGTLSVPAVDPNVAHGSGQCNTWWKINERVRCLPRTGLLRLSGSVEAGPGHFVPGSVPQTGH